VRANALTTLPLFRYDRRACPRQRAGPRTV
jgi:hypothetical protein